MRHVLALVLLASLCAACDSTSAADTGAGGGGGGGGTASGGGGGTTGGGGEPDAGVDAGPTRGSGDAGTPCRVDTDCALGRCVAWFRDAGAVCARPCASHASCADLPGFTCIPDRDGNGYCVPRSPAHCLACDFDEQCGGLSEVCVQAPGDTATTCRVDCALAGVDACPPGYLCSEVQLNGQPRRLCTPPAGRCADAPAGFCMPGSPPQPCSATGDAGVCAGQRTCANGTYGACDAPQPRCRSCDDAPRTGCSEELCAGATSTVAHCGACNAPCPGGTFPSTTNVECGDGGCTFSCKGENYDADDRPDSGCEFADLPTGNHALASATDLGSKSCSDSSSAFDVMGRLPSDTRVHERPSVADFAPAKGAAPDYLSITATGGFTCFNDVDVTLTVAGAPNSACYRLSVATNKSLLTCDTDASGACSVNAGSGAYSGGTPISIQVERNCSAASAAATYRLQGHL